MTDLARRIGAVLAPSVLAFGCTNDPGAASSRSRSTETAGLAAQSPYEAFALADRANGREILEVAPDGRAVVGTPVPVPPRSSAKLVYQAVYLDRDGRERAIPLASRIQDARFAFPPSALLAVLDDRDVLTVWNTTTGETRELDREVFPGFGFSHAGNALAYAKGLAPELDAYVAPLPSGSPRRLTSTGVPVWGFAFSPDDTRIVYVDAPDGFPCLTTMAADGSGQARFTNRTLNPADLASGASLAPFPDGRKPPVWLGNHVYVQDSQGVHAIDRLGNVVRTYANARDLHTDTAGRLALARIGDKAQEVEP